MNSLHGDLNVRLMKTSKVEREKKLLEMRKKVRAKRVLSVVVFTTPYEDENLRI